MAETTARPHLCRHPTVTEVNTTTVLPPLLITCGEPAGIGPELMGLLSEQAEHLPENRPLVILGDANLIQARAKAIGITLTWPVAGEDCLNMALAARPPIQLWHHPLNTPCTTGQPNSANARHVLDLLDAACDACLSGLAGGMVTAPIQKSAISPIWPGFQGHTEYLAQRCGQADEVVMMLMGGNMKVALATTHLPLRAVPDALTGEGLNRVLRILLNDLSTYWGLEHPKVLVAGLNPHAGEAGDLGHEDDEIIAPVLDALRAQGHQLIGPLPADTLFQPKYLNEADAVLAMYHDQGLPVLKYASFGRGVNVSLGLPIVRTSVDHGTALSLAGARNMDCGSLIEAIHTAHHMDLCRRTGQPQ